MLDLLFCVRLVFGGLRLLGRGHAALLCVCPGRLHFSGAGTEHQAVISLTSGNQCLVCPFVVAWISQGKCSACGKWIHRKSECRELTQVMCKREKDRIRTGTQEAMSLGPQRKEAGAKEKGKWKMNIGGNCLPYAIDGEPLAWQGSSGRNRKA